MIFFLNDVGPWEADLPEIHTGILAIRLVASLATISSGVSDSESVVLTISASLRFA